MSEAEAGVRYPACEVELLGTSANANAIIGRVRRALERHLRNVEKLDAGQVNSLVKEFSDEATSGDYDNVLLTCNRWVTVN